MLDDLVDFNRGELGLGVQIAPAEVDLAVVCAEAVDQLRTAYPRQPLELHVTGPTQGLWDGPRLQRVLDNLVANAISYGAHGAPIFVTLTGEDAEVCIDVTNTGPVIDPALLERIFEPLQRGAHQLTGGNLGLGLYIAREITRAHGGTVSGRSAVSGTTFTVSLPRRGPAAPPPA